MSDRLRVIIADDERPARAFLAALLRECGDVELVGEAKGGVEAIALIESATPDLALLDLQMPEVDGLAVVRLVKRHLLPLVAYVTAHDAYAVRAFEANAVDFLLKPVEPARLRQTLDRVHGRLARGANPEVAAERVRVAAARSVRSDAEYLRRIPVRLKDDIVLVPVRQLASVVADGELLHLTTHDGRRYTINYRLKDLETRLDPATFVRISRGALVNLDMLERVSAMPGGTYLVTLRNRQQLAVSRQRARDLREQLLKL
ncbi:MAG TPA: response regulator [Gemmatimonadaceae bacterium]|nr:response regulator [Gemmatimonadaceae bacterium]